MELGSDGRESVSTTDAISNKVKGKARSEKVILLEKSHRVSTSDATRLRVLTIIVSWVSVIVAFVLGTIAIVFAVLHSSQSLFAFGLDSLLDSISSIVILWRFHGKDVYSEIKELRACVMIGSLFVISAMFLLGKSIQALVVENHPDWQMVAIIIASINIVLCLLLGTFKVYLGYELESRALIIDSVITYTGVVMSTFSLVFSAVYNFNPEIWYLDDVLGIACAVFLFVNGIRVIVCSWRDLKRWATKET
ncbi:transmembrane protein 163-like [Mya arenaria]|uniref:transmembrane protein 163-like n=1 Tax=Mya arenaria TaxID=6604 RepID=UPI0022E21CF5|nr:transmembrane protein 163-like [Mya arenaria]